MNYKKTIKKQSIIIGVSVFVMALIIIGTSFAIVQQVKKSTETQVVETGTLSISYTSGTQITGSFVPLSNNDGLNQTGYSFTVENSGSLPMQYDVTIKNAASIVSPLQHQYIMISIDGSQPVLLSTLTKTAETASETNENNIEYVLLSGQTVASSGTSGSSKTHVIKVWIEEDAPEEIIGRTIALDVMTKGFVEDENTSGGGN